MCARSGAGRVPRRAFQTIPDELLEVADAAAEYFDSVGYTVRVEAADLGFPSTPALLCSRQRTRLVVEVDNTVRVPRIEDWAAYGRSAGQDFRVVLCLPREQCLASDGETHLRRLGIGCM